jgi:hypothetical protein
MERDEYPSEAVTTAAAQQVWQHVYGLPWPNGWKVTWGGAKNNAGACFWRAKTIELSPSLEHHRGCDYEPFRVLLHEFTHLRFPGLRHGQRFTRLCTIAWGFLVGDQALLAAVEEQAAIDAPLSHHPPVVCREPKTTHPHPGIGIPSPSLPTGFRVALGHRPLVVVAIESRKLDAREVATEFGKGFAQVVGGKRVVGNGHNRAPLVVAIEAVQELDEFLDEAVGHAEAATTFHD